LNGPLKNFIHCSDVIGGEIQEQAVIVLAAFKAQREFLEIAATSRRPGTDSELARMLKPTSDKITEIQSYRESRRRSEFFNHLSSVSESIPALGWVSVVSCTALDPISLLLLGPKNMFKALLTLL